MGFSLPPRNRGAPGARSTTGDEAAPTLVWRYKVLAGKKGTDIAVQKWKLPKPYVQVFVWEGFKKGQDIMDNQSLVVRKTKEWSFNWVPKPLYRCFAHRNYRRLDECKMALHWLDAGLGERILDIGCGDGYFSHKISMRGAKVVGIDIHRKRLSQAHERNKNERTTFKYMNAEDLDYQDGGFDKVISLCVIEHFEKPDAVLQEVYRVLKPGGTLVFSADSLSNPEITDRERFWHRDRYAVQEYYTTESVEEKLSKAGMVLERTHYLLTTPLTLSLVRFSWRMDRLNGWKRMFNEIVNVVLITAGNFITRMSENRARRTDSGLTLLVEARKPAD